MLKRFQKHSFLAISALSLLALGRYAIVAIAAGNSILWSNTATSTWQTGTNWTGGIVPGPTDSAQFGANPTGSATVGIDMGSNTNNGAGSQAVGSIETTSARTKNLTITNSSTTTDGLLVLNGATVNSVPNVVLRCNNSSNLTLTAGTKALNIGLGNATDNIVYVDGSGNVSIAATTNILDSGGSRRLTINGSGSGRMEILSAASTFSGGLFCKGAEFRAAGDLSIGPVPLTPSDNITVDGGRFGIVSGTAVTFSSNRNILLGTTPGTSISAVGATGVLTYDGVFKDLSSGGLLVKQGAGILQIGGASTFTGSTSINNGTLQLQLGSNRLPIGTTLGIGQAASTNLGVFDLNGFNQQVAGLNSISGTNATATKNAITSSTTASTLTLGGNGFYAYGDGSLANSGTITGPVSLVKNGSGTQTLGDVNTYSGPTSVNAGALLVTNTSGSATGTGNVTVMTGGTLGGTGTISGTVTVLDGILAPGVNGAGTLNTGALTLDANSILNFELGTVSDKIAVTGDLALSGTLNVSAIAGFASGRYTILTYTGNLTSNTLTLGTVPAPYTLAIDTSVAGQVAVVTVPLVLSINRGTPAQQNTNSPVETFTVTFNTSVNGVASTDFVATVLSGTLTNLQAVNLMQVSGSVYTVSVPVGQGSGEFRLDLIDDDSITDTNGTPLGLAGAGNGNFTAGQTYIVDQTPLTVTVNQAAGQADPTNVKSIAFTAVFNKPVSDFTTAGVSIAGTAAGATAGVTNSGDNMTYTITVSGMTSDGTVIATIPASQAHDIAGNANQASTSTDNQVTLDTTAPTVLNVASATSNGLYGIGAVIHITVQFSEPVLVTGSPQITLATGTVQEAGTYTSGSGTNTLVFNYTVAQGDSTALLDYVNSGALTLNGGSIADAAGNSATLALPAPGATGSLSQNASIAIDGVPATVTNVTASQPDATYGVGNEISIEVTFSKTVTIAGTPELALATGTATTQIQYMSGSGSTTLIFSYIVAPGDASADLDYTSSAALTLNGGGIIDAANNEAALALPAPGTAGSLGANKNIVIDTTPKPLSATPALGPTAGGTAVTISGSNLTQASVTFGAVAGTITTNVDAQIVVTAPPHASGLVDIVVTVPGGMATLAQAYRYDDPPVPSGPPTITTAMPLAGRPISVTVAATDPEGETLTILYDWGDGSPIDNTGTHVYASPGMYTLTVTISDGFNEVHETATVTVGATVPMTVTKLSGTYKVGGTETATATMVITGLPVGYVFVNQNVNVNIGGATQAFTLTSKVVKAVVGKSTLAVKAKLKKNARGQLALVSGPVTFTAKLSGSFLGVWAADDIDPTKTTKKQPIHMTVDCVFDNSTYTDATMPLLTGTANKSGSFTFSQK